MRYYVSLINRVRRARQEVEVSTQDIRSKLIVQLTEMFELAYVFTQTKKGGTPKQKELFMRVMAYIAQVINSLTKTFDEGAVTKDLQDLEKMIDEAMAKGKEGKHNVCACVRALPQAIRTQNPISSCLHINLEGAFLASLECDPE